MPKINGQTILFPLKLTCNPDISFIRRSSNEVKALFNFITSTAMYYAERTIINEHG